MTLYDMSGHDMMYQGTWHVCKLKDTYVNHYIDTFKAGYPKNDHEYFKVILKIKCFYQKIIQVKE